MHIIILDKNQVTVQAAVFAQVNDVLDEAFALVVARVRFAGENKLDRPLFVMHQLDDVVKPLENQRRAFVGGETAGETDGQGIGIEQLIERDKVVLRQSLALDEQAPAAKLYQFAAQVVTQRPDLLVGKEVGVGEALPEIR